MPDETIKLLGAQLKAALHSLKRLEREIHGHDRQDLSCATDPRSPAAYQAAIQIMARRQARRAHFKTHDIFGEPGWDMLLDLYVRQTDGERISVKSACQGAGVPSNTALRWLHALEREGLLCFEDDASDPGLRLIRLSPTGIERMTDYLATNTSEPHA